MKLEVSMEGNPCPCPWANLWTPISEDNLLGWVSSKSEADNVRKVFQAHISVSFIGKKKGTNFGEVRSGPNMGCKFGADKHAASKLRREEARKAELKEGRPRQRKYKTKKIGCPAKIDMKEVIRFPDFKPRTSTTRIRREAKTALRDHLQSGVQLTCDRRIYIRLPSPEDHNNTHLLDQTSTQSSVMKAVQQSGNGGPEVLGVGDAPIPLPGSKEVLLRIVASAINRADTLQRRGLYPVPAGASTVLGLEAAGEVYQLGPDTSTKWKKGDRVMALLSGGGNAQYATAHEDHLIPVPDHMTLQNAAAIPEVWLTAYQLLHFVANFKTGDTVLIHAGGSGVGTAATQLVWLGGGRPIVTAGSAAKLEKAKSLGAVAGFNYKEVDFAEKVLEETKGNGVDIILDCVGGSYWEQNVKSIAVDGSWVVYGLLGGPSVEGPLLGAILRKRVKVLGSTLRAWSIEYKTELVKAFTHNALPHFSPSSLGDPPQLRPIIDQVFPLQEIVAAHSYMDANKTIGKVILGIQDETKVHSEL